LKIRDYESMTIARMTGAAVAVGALLVMGPASVLAQGSGSKTANLRVTAEVVANCIVTTRDVAFGRYDPVAANQSTPLDSQGAVIVTCTRGAMAAVTLDQGQNGTSGTTQMANGAARLTYALYADAGHTLPAKWGISFIGGALPRTLAVYGRIAAGQDVAVGNYEDTVLVTVTF
jgi:spore coat protein U-like protein